MRSSVTSSKGIGSAAKLAPEPRAQSAAIHRAILRMLHLLAGSQVRETGNRIRERDAQLERAVVRIAQPDAHDLALEPPLAQLVHQVDAHDRVDVDTERRQLAAERR